MPLKIENVTPLPAVTRDNPTSKIQAEPRPARAARPKKAAPQAPASIDGALAGRQRAVTNRVAGDLWEQLSARADELGVPIRIVLTDAIVRVLETPADEHALAVRATRRREQLAKVEAEDKL